MVSGSAALTVINGTLQGKETVIGGTLNVGTLGVSGLLFVSGTDPNGPLPPNGTLIIGCNGDGVMNVLNGQVDTQEMILGLTPGSSGTVLVDGKFDTHAVIQTWGQVTVGNATTGSQSLLELRRGAQMTHMNNTGGLVVGNQVSSFGRVKLTNSVLNVNNNAVIIGNQGTGIVEVFAEGIATGGLTTLGASNTGAGTLTINAGQYNAVSDPITIGDAGTGIVSVTGFGGPGSLITAGGVLGSQTDSSGTVTVENGGSWFIGSNAAVTVGDLGAGTLNINLGGTVEARDLIVAKRAGVIPLFAPVSTLNLDGGALNLTGALFVGNDGRGTGLDGGRGEVYVSNTTLTSVGGVIGAKVDSETLALVQISSGSWNMSGAGNLKIGNTGTLDALSMGSVNVGSLVMGDRDVFSPTEPADIATISISGQNSLVSALNLTVADRDDAQILISAGGRLTTINATLAEHYSTGGVQVDALVLIDGVGSNWTNANNLDVGKLGHGLIGVTNGGDFDSVNTSIGSGKTAISGMLSGVFRSIGTVNITSATWNNTADLLVGTFGIGNVNITAGGTATTNTLQVATDQVTLGGNATASEGHVLISNTGSQLTVFNAVTLGGKGTATLVVSDNGFLETLSQIVIGQLVGSQGTAVIDAGIWNANGGSLTLGNSGVGSLDIINGGILNNSGFSRLGEIGGSNGTATVSGVGSQWSVSGNLQIGVAGVGLLTVDNSGELIAEFLSLAAGSGGQGTLQVTGGTVSVIDGPLPVGEFGEGSLLINTSGIVTSGIGAGFQIGGSVGQGFGTDSSATVDGAGSQWTVNGMLDIGSQGTGTVTVDNTATIVADVVQIANFGGGDGTLNVQNGSMLTVNDFIELGIGQLNITTGSIVTSTGAVIGEEDSATALLDGLGSNWNNSGSEFTIGDGDLTVSNTAQLTTNGALVGGSEFDPNDSGFDPNEGAADIQGTVNVQSNANWTNNGPLSLGGDGSFILGQGTITVETNASLTANGTVEIRDQSSLVVDGPGSTITQTGAESVVVGSAFGGTTSTIDVINGGTFSTGTDTISVNATGAINIGTGMTGGTFNANGSMTIDGAVNLIDGEMTAGVVTLSGGGAFNFTGGVLHVDDFIGNLENQGGTLAPGKTPGITNVMGEYTVTAGTLEVELFGNGGGAPVAGVDFDQLTADTANLGGTLELVIDPNYTPSVGDMFPIISTTSP